MKRAEILKKYKSVVKSTDKQVRTPKSSKYTLTLEEREFVDFALPLLIEYEGLTTNDWRWAEILENAYGEWDSLSPKQFQVLQSLFEKYEKDLLPF
jgi:hypothetical protein